MAEYVIIGGGVYGSGVAYWLSQNGADVRLLEAKRIGNGASAGPGRRGTRANGRDLRELPLVRLAHEIWPTLHEHLEVPQFFERTGHLLLIEREQDIALCEARALLQNQYGTETHVLGAGQVHEMEPGLSQNIIGALHCPLDGASDHTAVTEAFANAARRAGAEISENTVAQRLEINGGRVDAVVTSNGERIEVGKRLFILANAGVNALVCDRVSLPIWSRTFQVLLTKPMQSKPFKHLMGHASRTLALKSEPDNRIMISGGLPGVWNAETERGTALEASISANLADAISVYPDLAAAEIEVADADHLESSAIDNIPIIDRVSGVDNALYAAGWCGHGWAIAPPLTQMLVEWALTDTRPALLAPFSQDRFGAVN
ncbi:MAG: sarcosine oxidase subunit beta [Hyphomicrobiaceae bacterium]|jgi:sarcosine oxidase subunit beta